MITGFIGLPGSGKTYLLARQGLKDIADGKEVWANFKLEGAKHFHKLSDVVAILQVRLLRKEKINMTILIDEINLSFPSRMWQKIPGWVLYFFSQTRKFGLDIYYTSQAIDRVEKVIREITNYCWVCKTFFFGWHIAHLIQPEDVDKQNKEVFETDYFRIKPEVYEKYDTYEVLEMQETFLL